MEKHVKIIAWLYIAKTVLFLLIMLGVSGLVLGAGLVSRDGNAMGILAIIAVIMAWIGFIVSVPQVIAAWALFKRKNWGRILTIILSILNIFDVPFGTALGIYALVILFREDARAYFNR